MIDSNWSGKQLSSEKATGKVVHSMAQQTARAVRRQPTLAMQEPQEGKVFAGAENWGHGRQQCLSGTALPWPSPQLTLHSVPATHLSLPTAKAAQPQLCHILLPSSWCQPCPTPRDRVMRRKGEGCLSLMASDQCLAGGCLNLAVIFSLLSVLKD